MTLSRGTIVAWTNSEGELVTSRILDFVGHNVVVEGLDRVVCVVNVNRVAPATMAQVKASIDAVHATLARTA